MDIRRDDIVLPATRSRPPVAYVDVDAAGESLGHWVYLADAEIEALDPQLLADLQDAEAAHIAAYEAVIEAHRASVET